MFLLAVTQHSCVTANERTRYRAVSISAWLSLQRAVSA